MTNRLRVNAIRLRESGVNIDAIVGRSCGPIAAVTEDEMDAIMREIKQLARTRRMTDVVEFVDDDHPRELACSRFAERVAALVVNNPDGLTNAEICLVLNGAICAMRSRSRGDQS